MQSARSGDEAAFEELVRPHRRELLAHCYRMLGSLHDAEDALQETLLAAWRGLAGFEGRSSFRTWIYRIATTCCLRFIERRPARVLSWDQGPSRAPADDLGAPLTHVAFLDPWPQGLRAPDRDEPEAAATSREGVELAWVAALQHLPATQRAVLVLREVLAFSAAEVADVLETTPQAVNSALQRARRAIDERVSARVHQALPGVNERALVERFVTAWEHADVDGLVDLLAEDVRLTMPPLPAWFDGRAAVLGVIAQRIFATHWRLVPIVANDQPAFACYQQRDGTFHLSAVNVLSLRDGRIHWIAAFLDPAVLARLELPLTL